MARIISVYRRDTPGDDIVQGRFAIDNMSYLRWFKIADALARRGHSVEMAVPDEAAAWSNPYGLPQVPLSRVDWRSYDAVKTVFHRGFDTLEEFGGADHPCIISKLGSVVAGEDRTGIYFYGPIRERLFATQTRLFRQSRFVTVLNPMGRQLLTECHGQGPQILCVPGAADRVWPAPGVDPFPQTGRKRVLFAGLVYSQTTQPEANRTLVAKLNLLGQLLSARGIDLFMMGRGDLSLLDTAHVHYLGSVPYDKTTDYFGHADLGVVVAAGDWHHNNESSKIYHYLRAGLPVVAESGFPNDHILAESGLGWSTPAGDMRQMADRIVEVCHFRGNRELAMEYILARHTWDHRAAQYDSVLGSPAPTL